MMLPLSSIAVVVSFRDWRLWREGVFEEHQIADTAAVSFRDRRRFPSATCESKFIFDLFHV